MVGGATETSTAHHEGTADDGSTSESSTLSSRDKSFSFLLW